MEESATHICVDEFALRKGHNYATSVLNADTGRILAIVPHRDQEAITSVLQKITGTIRAVVSDSLLQWLMRFEQCFHLPFMFWIAFISSNFSRMPSKDVDDI
ncbi:transposase [Niallia hominis]|uniref:transposase n=1 Tax=Niallia hominis TaxID=3133173 RepID=UPI00338E7B6A